MGCGFSFWRLAYPETLSPAIPGSISLYDFRVCRSVSPLFFFPVQLQVPVRSGAERSRDRRRIGVSSGIRGIQGGACLRKGRAGPGRRAARLNPPE